MTTSAHDLRITQQLYATTCEQLGLIPDGFHLVFSNGSKTNGNAYRVALVGKPVTNDDGTTSWPNGSGHGRPPLGSDYLGWTKDEADRALRNRIECAQDLAHALKLHSITEISTDDHAAVLHYERPTTRDEVVAILRRMN